MSPHRIAAAPGLMAAPVAAGTLSAVLAIVTEAHAVMIGFLLVMMLSELVTSDHKARRRGDAPRTVEEEVRSKGRRLMVVLTAWSIDGMMVAASHASGVGRGAGEHGVTLGVTVGYMFYREVRDFIANVARREGPDVVPPKLAALVESETRAPRGKP